MLPIRTVPSLAFCGAAPLADYASCTQAFVDGEEEKSQMVLQHDIAPSDASVPLWLGRECQLKDAEAGIVGDVDNLRIWTTLRNSLEIRKEMFSMVDAKTPGLAAQWMYSQGLTALSAEKLTGSSRTSRQLTLNGTHSLQKSVLVGPFIWEVTSPSLDSVWCNEIDGSE